MTPKEKARCVDCTEWKRIDLCSGLCDMLVRRGVPQPARGESFSCEKAKLKTVAPEAPC